MDTCDWKFQLPPDARGKVVNKIFETLKKQLPFSGPEGLNELRRIATKFEDRIFNSAISLIDYLRQISMKMLTMETRSQNAGGSSLYIPVANNATSLDSGEPSVNSGDWRTQMPPDLRQKNADKIMETLKKSMFQILGKKEFTSS